MKIKRILFFTLLLISIISALGYFNSFFNLGSKFSGGQVYIYENESSQIFDLITQIKRRKGFGIKKFNCENPYVDGASKFENDFNIYLSYPVNSINQIHYVRIHTHWDGTKVELVYEAVYSANCIYQNIEHDFSYFERKKYISEFEKNIIEQLEKELSLE